ncbi:DUF1963 domain-containing protein, partial [Kitasatospora putterlickiae]
MAEPVTTDTPVTAPGEGVPPIPGEGVPPIPGEVAELIRARAGERLAPLVHGLFRSSLVLDPVRDRGPEDEAAGRLGGLPALPEGTGWPQVAGRPMQLLAELDCAALAAAFEAAGPDTGRWPLPAEGLLLFFHDEWFADFAGRGCRVLHVPAGAPPRPAPPAERGA